MTISEFYDEYNNLTDARKAEGLDNLLKTLKLNLKDNDRIIREFLYICTEYEDEDYFGTEGLDI